MAATLNFAYLYDNFQEINISSMISLEKVDRQQWMKFFTHLIVICMLFFLPDVLANISHPGRNKAWSYAMYLRSAGFVTIFYINYYLIIQHTLLAKRRNYLMFVVWNVLLTVSVFYLTNLASDTLLPPPHHNHKHHDLPRYIQMLRDWSWMLREVVMAVLTIALSAALRFAERWASLEKRNEQLLASQREEELEGLKNQLNPHFLFNTLNTIYSLVEIDPHEAQNAIHQLSKLLRYTLYQNEITEKLSHEIDFTKSYISLMEMRLGPDAVKTDFSNVATDPDIPPLIFVTLIENAFKHGNTGEKNQPIEISISSDTEGTVVCRTFNHFLPKSNVKGKEGGIGLANLRRRLHLIYGGKASLQTRISGNTYESVLTIHNTHPDHT